MYSFVIGKIFRKTLVSFHRPIFTLLIIEIASGRVNEIFVKMYAFFLFTEHILQRSEVPIPKFRRSELGFSQLELLKFSWFSNSILVLSKSASTNFCRLRFWNEVFKEQWVFWKRLIYSRPECLEIWISFLLRYCVRISLGTTSPQHAPAAITSIIVIQNL